MEAKQYKQDFDRRKVERSNWDTMYQVLGEYISLNKQNFEGQPAKGEFLIKEVFDSTGVFGAYNSASSLLGMLWTGSAKQALEIVQPDDMEESTELSEFYEMMTIEATRHMDDANANLTLALDEYMLDQMIFGTSGVGVEKGVDSKLLYKPYGVKELYIDEGRNGRVNVANLFYEWTITRLVDEYGIENVSEKSRKTFEAGQGEQTIKVLITIQPRKEKKAELGMLSLRFESIHMEYDSCHIMREEGFSEFPIPVTRYRKLNYEKYGRSAGMNALPDIREANALREAVIIATEKSLDMPQGVIDGGMLGGGFIDTSAGAITVFNASANVGNSPPIFDIGKQPEIRAAMERLEDLKETISRHFNIDRLLDFNNDVQMTFGEAQIRDQLRTSSLSGLFARQISELFTPLFERSMNILWRDGVFGVVEGSEEELEAQERGEEVKYLPEAIVKRLEQGKDVYQIVYKTKAANASKAEEYIAILDVMNFALQAMQVDEGIRDRVDLHEALKEIGNIRGLPVGVLRQDDKVEAIQKSRQEQQQAAQTMEMAQQGTQAVKTLAEAKAIGEGQ
jgi:hypothetical protein